MAELVFHTVIAAAAYVVGGWSSVAGYLFGFMAYVTLN